MRSPFARMTLLLPLLFTLGCQTTMPIPNDGSVRSTVPLSLQVPLSVERLAILYPKTYRLNLMDAYAQLAGGAFQLKESRPWLQIVERFDLPIIHSEQQYQLIGGVSDATAVRLGRELGVDSILMFNIEGPTARDRVLSKLYGGSTPFTVVSKVISVESAEVLYLNVVTVPVTADNHEDFVHPVSRDLLGQGITKTILDLQHAFR